MTRSRAGRSRTIFTHCADWNPAPDSLPDPETRLIGLDSIAYSIRYEILIIRNDHIIARTTVTPRTEGLFGLNGDSDFNTVSIIDNIVECRGAAYGFSTNHRRDDTVVGVEYESMAFRNMAAHPGPAMTHGPGDNYGEPVRITRIDSFLVQAAFERVARSGAWAI